MVIARHAVQQRHDLLDAARVEIGERLVEQEQCGLTHERVGNEDALLLTARKAAHPTVGEVLSVDVGEERLDSIALFLGSTLESVTLRVKSQRHEIARSDGNVGVEEHLLRDVAK